MHLSLAYKIGIFTLYRYLQFKITNQYKYIIIIYFQMRLHPPGTENDKESTKWEKAYKKVVRKRKRQQSQ